MSYNLERWNSKGTQGTILNNVSKKVLALSYTQSDPYMINPSIESYNFLLWHEKKLIVEIVNFIGNRKIKFHEFKLRVCVNTF